MIVNAMGGAKHTRHGPWEWQYVNSAAAVPFDLDLDSNRLPSTIASLVNFVFVYNLALNCCCYRVAQNTRFISVYVNLLWSS